MTISSQSTPESQASNQGVLARALLSVQLRYYGALLKLQSQRHEKPGGPVSVFRDDSEFGVIDDNYKLTLPSARRITRYRGGISWRNEKLALRYGCPWFYDPRAGDVVLDIGSNVGEFSLYAASRGARVIAFEPDPRVYFCLSRNLACLPDATALQLALWNERSTLHFYSAVDRADSSLIEPESNIATVCEVDALPLDQVSEIGTLANIDFIKIDGEGAEPEILQGAEETLRKTQKIAIDVGPERHGESTRDDVRKILESFGFATIEHDSTNELFAENTLDSSPTRY